MTSQKLIDIDHEFSVGEIVYVPFWIVQDFLDQTNPDPFIKCTVIALSEEEMQSPIGPISVRTCDLNLGKSDLVAPKVLSRYLIVPDQLATWANIIGNWFANFQPKQC